MLLQNEDGYAFSTEFVFVENVKNNNNNKKTTTEFSTW